MLEPERRALDADLVLGARHKDPRHELLGVARGELLHRADSAADKELGELVYAATFLPTWLYAPTGGLRALLGDVAGIETHA